jgi:hypothetical protein
MLEDGDQMSSHHPILPGYSHRHTPSQPY